MHLYADSTVIINLQALVQNYHTLSQHAGNAQCAAVVKADAYGLGIEPVSKALAQAGCKHFFVAHLNEAIELRSLLPEVGIYVFHGLMSGQEDVFKSHNIVPVLNGIRQVVLWQQAAVNNALPCVIHIDTGMNRLGMSYDDIATLLTESGEIPQLDIRLVMSHLASADKITSKDNQKQLDLFEKVKSYFPNSPMSLANSAGIYLGENYHFGLVRPGCALYGVVPSTKAKDIKPVVTLKTKMIQLRDIAEGERVGYGGDFITKKPSTVATIPVGYADGYLRCIGSNKKSDAHVMVAGKKAPIIGRISMDLITIDVTDIPKAELFAGAEVELIGEAITVNDVAKWGNTIGYEILTSLGKRYKKVYRTNAEN